MKYKALNISEKELQQFKDGRLKSIDLVSIEKFMPTTLKNFTQHFIFSELSSKGHIFTYVILLTVNGYNCSTEVSVIKFNPDLNKDSSNRTYGGSKILEFLIDTEDNSIYYLSEIAAIALNEYIENCM